MRRVLTILFVLAAFSGPSAAATGAVSQYVPDAQLVGKARLKYLVWNVFDAELYAPMGRWRRNAPYALKLSYLRNISGKTIVDQSVDEMRKQGFSNEPVLLKWRRQMGKLFADVSSKTTITGIRDQNGYAIFFRNQRKIGAIKDREFSRRFFDIWLSDKASQRGFQRKLVGKNL